MAEDAELFLNAPFNAEDKVANAGSAAFAAKAGVAAVIADVTLSMGWDVLKGKKWLPILIMFASFLAAAVLHVNVMVIILICAVIGLLATLHDERNGKAGA